MDMVYRTAHQDGTASPNIRTPTHSAQKSAQPPSAEPFRGRAKINSPAATAGMALSEATYAPPSKLPLVSALIWTLYMLNVFFIFLVILEVSFQNNANRVKYYV
jgi:hypothetical protein